MRRACMLIIVIIAVITAGIWETSYLRESSRYFLTDINNVYQIYERNDYELAKKESNNLHESWKDIKKTWALFIEENELDKVDTELVSFVSYIDSKDTDEVKHSYNCLSSTVNDIIEFQCLKPENVF